MLACATAPYNLVSLQMLSVALSISHPKQAGLLVERFHTYKGTDLPLVRGCSEAADHLNYASWNRYACIRFSAVRFAV